MTDTYKYGSLPVSAGTNYITSDDRDMEKIDLPETSNINLNAQEQSKQEISTGSPGDEILSEENQ